MTACAYPGADDPAGLRLPPGRIGPQRIGALLVAAGLGTAAEPDLISLLVINGLRISEALGADIDARPRLGSHAGSVKAAGC